MFISKNEINTGRQTEFDYLKGFFVPMIIIIHAFQLMGGTAEPFYEVFYPICTMTGSTIFLFVMGLGSTYSNKAPKHMALTGLKLIGWQGAWNVFALALPFLLGQGIRAIFGLSMEMWPVAVSQTVILLQYVNIFFIAGISYLLLALFKKIKLPAWAYLLLAAALFVATPFLYRQDSPAVITGIGAVDYVIAMFCGGRDSVSLIFLPHFVYTLFGVWFGKMLRRTKSKKALYLTILPIGLLISASYMIYAIVKNPGLTDFCNFMSIEYTFPGMFRMAANLSSTLLCAALLYAASPLIKKIKPLESSLLHFNKRTSAYYAIHPFVYSLIASLLVMAPTKWYFCLGVAFVNTFIVWAVIKLWDTVYRPKKK